MDHSGAVNALDALLLMRYVMNIATENDLYLDVADLTGEGQFTALDALAIMRIVMDI